MSGLPSRPGRDDFGPDVENSAPVRDPRKQIDASIFNLLMWQVSGMGIVAPRTALVFVAQPSPTIVSRLEAWNPRQLTTGAYADPSLTRNATGDYTVEYPTPVPDEIGEDVAISFTWAHAFVVNADPLVLKHAQAAPVAGNTNRLRVGIFNSAGAAQDGNTVALFGW